MQLEDVERLEKLRDERDAAAKRLSGANWGATAAWRVASERYDEAFRDLRPALLALAREALERRRDAAVMYSGGQSFTIEDCTFEQRPLTPEERDEINRGSR